MRSGKIKFFLVALIVPLYCFVAGAASLGAVRGRVFDSEGAAIKEAHLLFHSDMSGRTNPASAPDIVRETDTRGYFEVQLRPGFYDMCIMAKAFTPECRKILVSKENVQQDVHLNADPLVIKHLGDTF